MEVWNQYLLVKFDIHHTFEGNRLHFVVQRVKYSFNFLSFWRFEAEVSKKVRENWVFLRLGYFSLDYSDIWRLALFWKFIVKFLLTCFFFNSVLAAFTCFSTILSANNLNLVRSECLMWTTFGKNTSVKLIVLIKSRVKWSYLGLVRRKLKTIYLDLRRWRCRNTNLSDRASTYFSHKHGQYKTEKSVTSFNC